MMAVPELLLLMATAGLGLFLGVLYLRGERRPYLIGVHLLLGAAALEGMLLLMHGTPNGDVLAAGPAGTAALLLFGAAMFSGLTAPLFRRQSRRTSEMVLVTHVGVGILGVLLFLAWVAAP